MYSHQFGELRRPRVGSDDSRFGDPVLIHSTQSFDCPLTLWGLIPTDQDAIRLLEVPHRCSLCQELRVGQHLKKNGTFAVRSKKPKGKKNLNTTALCVCAFRKYTPAG